MRVIKFRAYHKISGKMLHEIYSFTCYGSRGKINGIVERDYEDLDYPEDIELMQYTGLHDKNGREIYEGDILGSEHFDNSGVIFMNGAFFCGDHDLFDVASGYHGDCLIVGNIYENPELLKRTCAGMD